VTAGDSLEHLWTPYRMAYIRGENKPENEDEETCPFCRAGRADDDAAALVVARGDTAYVVLNLYPYNSGHLMVCPYRHVALYDELTADEVTEIGLLTQTSMSVLRGIGNPHGFNIGMNQGSVAGAGIAAHLHQHIVPRWGGDTNFMPVVAQTKVMPQLLEDTRRLIADAWPS
jgi:ATP adenylyltransferase